MPPRLRVTFLDRLVEERHSLLGAAGGFTTWRTHSHPCWLTVALPSGLLEESEPNHHDVFQSGHSRNSSYASQHSKISGTVSAASSRVKVPVNILVLTSSPPLRSVLLLLGPCRLQHRALLLLQPVGPHASQEHLHRKQRLWGRGLQCRPAGRGRQGRRTS